MNETDIEYDYRLDSLCGDPDADSLKLYNIHIVLWNQKLADNEVLSLKYLNKSKSRLILKTNLTDNLSSDRMCPHFVGKYNGKFDSWLTILTKKKFNIKSEQLEGI